MKGTGVMAVLLILSTLMMATTCALNDDLFPTYRDDDEQSARIAVVSVQFLFISNSI